MAFPCDQFGNFGTKNSEKISKEVGEKFGVKFSLFVKVQVNGVETHPVYKYLRSQPLMTN